jgi:hypothetical protein
MVFMYDERDVADLRKFHETASKPNQTVICVYDTWNMVEVGFGQISHAIAAFAKETRHLEILMANGTRVRFTTRDLARDGRYSRGRDNVTVIG